MPSLGFVLASGTYQKLASVDTPTCNYFFNSPATYIFGAPPPGAQNVVPAALPLATPTIRYSGLAKFQSDLAAGTIDAAIRMIMYDPEATGTPPWDTLHPALGETEFVQAAHSAGYECMMTPARDLMNVSGADCTKQAGESLDDAYIRCGLPLAGAQADIFEVQAQRDELDVAAFSSLVDRAAAQVNAVNPAPRIYAGLTTILSSNIPSVTADQLYAAHESVASIVDGYWLNLGSSDPTTFVGFLQKLRAAGY